MAENTQIYYTRPSIGPLEVQYAEDAAKYGWGSRCYEYIHKFEALFREYLGSSHSIATSSCTGAMHIGLKALGLEPGDEVILAETNWVATVSPIHHMGLVPVFVDIDPETWCIDPAAAERAITPRTRAIIATHIYGNLCDMDALLGIGQAHGIPIVEDAAEALGSVYKGRRAGSMGAFGTFSFHGTKTLTTGEGGMLVTSDPDLFETATTLSNHGRAAGQTKQFWPDMIGFKYKMSNIEAALGCAQMERIEELTGRKREILQAYKSRLSTLQSVSMNPEPEGIVNGAWMPTAVFAKELGVTREILLERFKAANIDARVFFYPLSALDMFETCDTNSVAWDIPGRAINLPSYHDMTQQDIDRVCDVIFDLLKSE